jgi:hypothetical protein
VRLGMEIGGDVAEIEDGAETKDVGDNVEIEDDVEEDNMGWKTSWWK